MKQGNDSQPPELGLTVSDWITFLSSEKGSGLGNVIGAAGIFIAAFVVISGDMASSTSSALPTGYAWVAYIRAASILLVGASFIWLVVNTLRALGRPATKAQKLLDGIMRGDETLRTEQQIREAWIKLNTKETNKRKRNA